MDIVIPPGLRESDDDRSAPAVPLAAKDAPLTVISAGVRYGVLRMDDREIVVETSGRPPLRGCVDLIAGGVAVARLLLQHAWAADGRAGFELKRRLATKPARAVPHGDRGGHGLAPEA
ncbi:MAG: hypothetical protein AAF074_04890 [Pseudomonadota bacterium]